jgi:hypothetical protein
VTLLPDGVTGVGSHAGRRHLAAPVLAGPTVGLRALLAEDLRPLYEAELRADLWLRWRQKGANPPFEQWVVDLQRDTAVSMVAVRHGGGVVGVLFAVDLDVANRHCGVAAARLDGRVDPAMGEAGALFVQHLFRAFTLEKVYLHVPEYNLGDLGSLSRIAAEREGVLRRHELLDGRWWDLHVLAIHRQRWEAIAGGVFAVLVSGRPTVDSSSATGATRGGGRSAAGRRVAGGP